MRFKLLGVLAAVLLPFAANAEMSYRNVDFAYFLSADIDARGRNVDGDGLQLRGMIPVTGNFFVLAEFQSLNFDNDTDVTRFAVGGGGHWPLSSTVDIIARLGVANVQVDEGNVDDDDTGLFLGGRIRAMVTPEFELEGGIEHFATEAASLDDETFLVAEARYHFNSQWSAGVLANIGSDTSMFGIHARLSF